MVRQILEMHHGEIHGMIHCSGGGQTKVLHFVDNLHIIKDNLFSAPHLFRVLQAESGTSWQEMYRVFNMGHRMELYLPEHIAASVVAIANSFGIEAAVIGHCESSSSAQLTIRSEFGEFCY